MGMTKHDLKKRIRDLEEANAANAQELLLYRTRFGPLKFPEISPEELKSAEELGYVPITLTDGSIQYQSNQGYTRDNEGKYAAVTSKEGDEPVNLMNRGG